MSVVNRVTHLGLQSDVFRYVYLLRASIKTKDLVMGRACHSQMIVAGFIPRVFVGNLLMTMCLKCGLFRDARQVFDRMPQRDAVSWNMGLVACLRVGDIAGARTVFEEMPQRSEMAWDAMICEYLQQGELAMCLSLFQKMRACGGCVCSSSLSQKLFSRVVGISGSVGDVNLGKILHSHVLKLGFRLMLHLGNALVDMYAKCGEMDFAQKTFERLPEKDASSWNSILSGYLRNEGTDEVVALFASMNQSSQAPNQFTFALVLSACARLGMVGLGMQVHCSVVKTGFEFNPFCEGSLIDMYCKCNYINDARLLFDKITRPDTVSWTAMISGYVQVGGLQEALKLFLEMWKLGAEPDRVTFATIISACASQGMLDDAQRLFHQLSNPNVVVWNAMISGNAQNGHENEALRLFQEMRLSGVKPTRSTYGSILSVCAHLTDLVLGQQIHSEVIKLGLDKNVYVGSALITVYSRCSIVEDAHEVFVAVDNRNIVLWNAILGCYAQNSDPSKVVELFASLLSSSFQPDEVTYTSILNACACLSFTGLARQLHCNIIKDNRDQSLCVGNALIDMYGKLGNIEDARQQFDLMMLKDTITWNSMVAGYVQGNDVDEAIYLFCQMMWQGISPDEVSFACALSMLANLDALEAGKQMHASAIKSGFELNLYVGSALVDMYAKCASMEEAHNILAQMPESNVVSRNALIAGYVQNDQAMEAIDVFRQMQAAEVKATEFTFSSILVACDGLCGLNMGKQVHGYVIKTGFISEAFLGITLIGMYARCQTSEDACLLFRELNGQSTVSWTAIISGLIQNGLNKKALDFFLEMRSINVEPDHATFASILKACASLAALEDGKKLHSLIIRTGFAFNTHTSSALIDMYAKCGDIVSATAVFNTIDNHDIISWNAMITGFAKNGNAEYALNLFKEMHLESVKPDDITFLGVLTACCHSGLVSEGCQYFKLMVDEYELEPRADHYACMVDLLGRGGYLNEALEFLSMLPFEPDSVVLASLLGSCRVHGNELIGAHIAKKLMDVEPQSSYPYVLLSNLYASSGNWEEVRTMRKIMKEKQVNKFPGCSWIIIGDKTHSFVAGDKCHPESVEVYELLNSISAWIKEEDLVSNYESTVVEEC
ncbi:pentatricopeptide repeat-containing protein At3g09040, mitochondrial isoform X1 [Nymphaea colorata]|nr:pentatricopeptide repeat-containing protein At3g09040, mitochondrial isoform X1 [Nymphaea colorata]XP_031486021.1 pentatricopeptide repeat-containing protein At3g09040, mitochondrial isoform X1 [Nymphaea colorata]XP_031486022.1 pentatricopeptide repeat-containing protein At3g09040, mitochondrial isoform X1 [Nymphaea colorata]XP_031486023.1 pentatricopeptide repeat-containing protein At3g09040, mitochondrial isoform X1 [Nymphaea colorata]XP_031486025.1 pentatricopeptide repeat-containing prot